MLNNPNLLEVERAAGIYIAPKDGRTRHFDQEQYPPSIGVVYFLPNQLVTIHTGFDKPSNN
jgi:hypothetical protein